MVSPAIAHHQQAEHHPDSGNARSGAMPPLAIIDGWGVTAATLQQAIDAAISASLARRPTSLVTLNLDHVVKLRREPRFRDAYRRAAIVTADGAPIVWLARLQGVVLTRATGADIVIPLSAAAARNSLAVAMFGTSDAVLSAAANKLTGAYGTGVQILHSESPPMGFDPAGAAADAALDRMVAAGARICFLALGAPKQELMAARAVERGLPITCVSIGAALDFIAGRQRRAPMLMQRLGLEWVWRLASEPRRLFWRYAQCAAVLADIVIIAPLRQRLGWTGGQGIK